MSVGGFVTVTRMRMSALVVLALAVVGADEPFPRTLPLEPGQALKSFQLQDGFHVDLLAAEPLVTDPVAAAYDEDGRLYVVEMTDYPHVRAENDKPFTENLGDPPIGCVRLLVDRNNDGVFDGSTKFADNLSWPTGVLVWKGGVFVSATPDIWYLRDNDGDGVADVRERVFTGFRKFNVQAVMNTLQWGLDHLAYGAGSSNGGKVRKANEAADTGVETLRRDFRFDPGTRQFEAISGGARFGNTFDDWGDRFICDIRNPAQHVVLPSRYLARNAYLPAPRAVHDAAEAGDTIKLFRISPAEPWRELRARRWSAVGKVMPRSELFGAGYLTSSAGITCYRGDAYPESYRGSLFLGEVANNLIHRMAVEPDGVTFRARRAETNVEFLASTDTWFRPTNFVNAPDGTLHALDMYRETIEHPWSIPDDIRARLDPRSGEDRGRIYRLTPPGFVRRPTPQLSKLAGQELVALLEHPNAWHSETAHRLIYERQDRSLETPLRAMLRTSKDARARLRALYSLDGLGALREEDVLVAIGDKSPHLREHGLLLAEPRLKGSAKLRGAVVRLAEDPEIRVRFQAALTLGEIPGDEPTLGLAAIARRDAGDAWVRTAVLSSATANPAGLFEKLWGDRAFATSAAGQSLIHPLALVIGARGRADELARIVAAIAGTAPDATALDAAIGLGDGLARNHRRLSDLKKHVSSHDAEWLESALQRAGDLTRDDATPTGDRLQAIALLGQGDFDRASAILPKLLDSQQAPVYRTAAVRSLAGFEHPEVAGILLKGWKSYPPALRTEVIGFLLGRRTWLPATLDAIAAGTVSPGQIPPTRRAILLNDRDETIRARAQQIFGKETIGPRAEAIAHYRPALEKSGDSERGRKVFERECLACHKVGERGIAVGPNLAGIRRKTAEEILVNILDPNREVSPEFLEFTAALDDGRIVSGLIASETPSGVTLRAREGVEQTILRRNLAEIASTGKSLMPEGLEKTIKPEEMADLVTFLLRLQD